MSSRAVPTRAWHATGSEEGEGRGASVLAGVRGSGGIQPTALPHCPPPTLHPVRSPLAESQWRLSAWLCQLSSHSLDSTIGALCARCSCWHKSMSTKEKRIVNVTCCGCYRSSQAPFSFVMNLMVPGPRNLALVITWAAEQDPHPLQVEPSTPSMGADGGMSNADSDSEIGSSPFDILLARWANIYM